MKFKEEEEQVIIVHPGANEGLVVVSNSIYRYYLPSEIQYSVATTAKDGKNIRFTIEGNGYCRHITILHGEKSFKFDGSDPNFEDLRDWIHKKVTEVIQQQSIRALQIANSHMRGYSNENFPKELK